MAKYIDLEKYHKWLESTLCGDNCDSVSDGYCYTHECADCYADNFGGKEDVAPVIHAKWIFLGTAFGTLFKCSSCNNYQREHGNYCTNCGAKMDLKE